MGQGVSWYFTMQTRLRFQICPYCRWSGTGTGFSTHIYRHFEGPYCLRIQVHAVVMSTQEVPLNILLNASTDKPTWCDKPENLNLQIGYSMFLSTHNAATCVSHKGPYKIHLGATTAELCRKLKCFVAELPQEYSVNTARQQAQPHTVWRAIAAICHTHHSPASTCNTLESSG
jgi:hypothetical protein